MNQITYKEEVVLPFVTAPIMQVYQHLAFELGILQGNNPEIYPWILNNYINQYSACDRFLLNYVLPDQWFCNAGITRCQKFSMYRADLDSNSFSILDFIREMLCRGNYAYGFFNEFYIPGKFSYQLRDFTHGFFLYGYNDEKKIFYGAGYQKGRKYGALNITYENYLNALRGFKKDILTFKFFKYLKGPSGDVDIRGICDDIYDYLHSISRRPNIVEKGKCFGLESGDMYIKYLEDLYESGGDIDMRHSRFLLEAKSLMHERIEWLRKSEYLESDDLAGEYEKVKQNAVTMHALGMKYLLAPNKDIISRLVDLQKENQMLEQKILTRVLNELYRHLEKKNNLLS